MPMVSRSLAAYELDANETGARMPDQASQWLDFLSSNNIHPKLSVSSPGDADEREADAVAERVMRMAAPAAAPIAVGSGGPGLARACAACSQDDEDSRIARKARAPGVAQRAARGAAEAVSTGGHPLAPAERAYFEPRFGHDLGAVRIHTGPGAHRAASGIGALAYTRGQHIAFAAGQYRPDTGAGLRLLAHELAHVVQQRGSSAVMQREVDDESGAEGESADAPFDFVDEAEELDFEDAGAATADVALEDDPGDLFDAAGGSKKKNKKNTAKNKKNSSKSGSCAGDCPQGKQPKIINNDCAESQAVDKTNFITKLDVKIGAGELAVTWSKNKTETWPCTANPSATPKTTDEVVGLKCSKNHTNGKKSKDGMAWFTGFRSEGKRIGFHDSQPVGPGFKSHGCVRVCCDKAELINKNSSSGVTKITVAK